jgi:CheY-like chemotaxis protein
MSGAVKPLTVLVVDDDPGDVLMIREALEASPRRHRIEVAQDGEQAMGVLRHGVEQGSLPDVILLDLNMPRLSGMQLLKMIKGDERWRRIPVVVLTTSRAPKDIRASYDLHANAYVTKPLSLQDFTDIVRQIDEFFGGVASLPKG